MPEGISLGVFQVRHFRSNKGMKGCKLRDNIVLKCKSAMLSDKKGLKGTRIEEARNRALKGGPYFLDRDKPWCSLQLFQALELFTSKLLFSNLVNKTIKKFSTKIGSNIDTLHLKYTIKSISQHLRVQGFLPHSNHCKPIICPKLLNL